MTDEKRASDADLPTGTVEARAVLFEEEGQYGPVFILQLADFLKAMDTTRSAQTLSAMQVVCEMVLRKHLGPRGTYSLHGSAFYIFRFGRLSAAEARRRARLAVDEIGHNLLGPQFAPFASQEQTDPSRSSEAPKAARDAVRRTTENDWQVSSPAASDGAEEEASSRARQRRDAHAHARDADSNGNGNGGGTAGDDAASRMKRAAQI